MTLRELTTCFFIFETQRSTFKIVGKYSYIKKFWFNKVNPKILAIKKINRELEWFHKL